MDANDHIRRQFKELSEELGQIHKLDEYTYGAEAPAKWATSAASLMRSVFGEESVHYKQFQHQMRNVGLVGTFEVARGIFAAARDDFERGALINVRRLVRAELFANFLEQSEALLEAGYKGPAAVLAGAVLEDGLRKLCGQAGIALSKRPKMDSMNADLAKKEVYDMMRQKQITWIADIRNKAAHGEWDKFNDDDVQSMIQQVSGIISEFIH